MDSREGCRVEVEQGESLGPSLPVLGANSSLVALPTSPLCSPVFLLHTAPRERARNMQIRSDEVTLPPHAHSSNHPDLIW